MHCNGKSELSQKINTQDYCCFQTPKLLDLNGPESEFLLHKDGDRDFVFSPLGNIPNNPKLALIGITPGSQSEFFIKNAQSLGVEAAAKKAAFNGAHAEIKKLLVANNFARTIDIDIGGKGVELLFPVEFRIPLTLIPHDIAIGFSCGSE